MEIRGEGKEGWRIQYFEALWQNAGFDNMVVCRPVGQDMIMGEIGKSSDDCGSVALGVCQFPEVVVHLAEGFTGHRSLTVFGFVPDFDDGQPNRRRRHLKQRSSVMSLPFVELTVIHLKHLRARMGLGSSKSQLLSEEFRYIAASST